MDKIILWIQSCMTSINKTKVCLFHSTTASTTIFPCRLRYPHFCCWEEREHLFLLCYTLTRVAGPALFIMFSASVFHLTFLRSKWSEIAGRTDSLQLKVSLSLSFPSSLPLSLPSCFYRKAERAQCADTENTVQG